MTRWSLVAVLLIAASFSGCFQNGEGKDGFDASGTSTSSESTTTTSSDRPPGGCGNPPCTPSISEHIVNMLDCNAYFAVIPADGMKVRDHLPPGYAGDNLPAGTIGLDGWSCKSVVMDNATVSADFQMFYVTTLVQPPSAVSTDGANGYAFELCTNNDAVNALLVSGGFATCLGEVAGTKTGPIVNVRYSKDGALIYELSAAIFEQDADPTANTFRIHQGNGGLAAFMDGYGDLSDQGFGSGGVQVSGGVLAELLAAPQAVAGAIGTWAGDFELKIPTEPTKVT